MFFLRKKYVTQLFQFFQSIFAAIYCQTERKQQNEIELFPAKKKLNSFRKENKI